MQHEATRRRVLGAGLVLVVLQVAFRAWALYPSWFVTDDYRLLAQARTEDLGSGYLTTPFDGHLMPLGRLLVWLVARSGDAPWAVTATVTLTLQAVAALACLWMLVTLFGHRWAVVGLLALYLTSAVPLPATMWWAASLIALPLQVVLFVAVGTWVRHLRSGQRRWLAVTVAVLVLGLLSDVKSVLVVGVLGWLLLAHFTPGRGPAWVRSALRDHLAAVAVIVALPLAYAVYYLTQVPSPAVGATGSLARDLAGTLIGRSLATGLVGGPWRWDPSDPPVAGTDPPGWAVWAAWLVLLGVGIAIARARRRTGRAWALLAIYAGLAYLLLLLSRAPSFGPQIGGQLRYLTDVLPVAVLCLGLALLPLAGAPGSSTPRGATPDVRLTARRVLAPVGALVCVGGLLSSIAYVQIYHDDNPGAAWAQHAVTGLRGSGGLAGPVALADQIVPEEVMPGFVFPYNTTQRILPLLVGDVAFPDVAENLVALAESGEPRRAVIEPAVRSPVGPEPGCGWRVSGPRPTRIPLEATALDYDWWIRIGYLGSDADAVTVTTGDVTTRASVRRGLHNLFLRVSAEIPSVRLSGLSPGSTLCVDVVEIGAVVPGGSL